MNKPLLFDGRDSGSVLASPVEEAGTPVAGRKAGHLSPAASLYCQWLWHGITVLCDGTVTCGLDDPFKFRNYGNVSSATLRDIFARAAVKQRRQDLLSGTPCHGCSMYTTAAGQDARLLTPSSPYPRRLILEPSIKCNIRCRNSTCDIANDGSFHLRREDFLSWPLFRKLMDEVGPHLQELYFYNYGEPFAHPKALDMLAYAKQINPAIEITTSTNGILLAREGAVERIVQDGLLDFICFTIGGVDQQTYSAYHKAGSFAKAFGAMRRMMEEKRRLGCRTPVVHWRYLLFNWNDDDDCIAEALRLKQEIGVDEFAFMLSWTPMDGRSLRRAPGTPGFAAIAPHVAFQDGYCAEPYAEAGLWQPETCPHFGRFCWTGARASIRAKPAGGRIRLRLARHDFPTVAPPSVRITAPWAEAAGRVGVDQWIENSLEVPDAFAADTVDLTLEVDPIFSPLRHRDSQDSRDLGVMIALDGISPTPNPFRTEFVPAAPVSGRTR